MKTSCVEVHIGFFHGGFPSNLGGLRGIISWDPGVVCQAVQFLRSLGSPFPNTVIAYRLSLFVCQRWPQRSFEHRKKVGLFEDSYGFGKFRRTDCSVRRERSTIRYTWQRPHRRVSSLGIQESGFHFFFVTVQRYHCFQTPTSCTIYFQIKPTLKYVHLVY